MLSYISLKVYTNFGILPNLPNVMQFFALCEILEITDINKTFQMGQVYVMIAFSIFPVIIVYILLSRFIVEGVSAGAVKG